MWSKLALRNFWTAPYYNYNVFGYVKYLRVKEILMSLQAILDGIGTCLCYPKEHTHQHLIVYVHMLCRFGVHPICNYPICAYQVNEVIIRQYKLILNLYESTVPISHVIVQCGSVDA